MAHTPIVTVGLSLLCARLRSVLTGSSTSKSAQMGCSARRMSSAPSRSGSRNLSTGVFVGPAHTHTLTRVNGANAEAGASGCFLSYASRKGSMTAVDTDLPSHEGGSFSFRAR